MVDSYASINISNLKQEPITRDKSHIMESKIRENYMKDSCMYSNTMNHQVKIKDTKKSMFPVAETYDNNDIFKSTLTKLKATDSEDPYRTGYFNKRMDLLKKYTDEMLKAENMMKKNIKLDMIIMIKRKK